MADRLSCGWRDEGCVMRIDELTLLLDRDTIIIDDVHEK